MNSMKIERFDPRRATMRARVYRISLMPVERQRRTERSASVLTISRTMLIKVKPERNLLRCSGLPNVYQSICLGLLNVPTMMMIIKKKPKIEKKKIIITMKITMK